MTGTLFEAQIAHAREFIERVERCQREGINNVSPSIRVHEEEYRAWFEGTRRLVTATFGDLSDELAQLNAQERRLSSLLEGAIRETDSAFPGYIAYYQACIALLREFQGKQLIVSVGRAHAVRETHTKSIGVPDSIGGAALQALWPGSRTGRALFVISTGAAIVGFAIWSSLPDDTKDRVITWLFR
jgi:hypothetical protein